MTIMMMKKLLWARRVVIMTKMANPVKTCQQWRKYNGESGIKISKGLAEM